MKFAAHVVDSPAVFILLIDVILVGQQQVEEPPVKFLMEKQQVAVILVPLGEHVEVHEGPLPQQIVRLANQIDDEINGSWILDFIVVVNHQLAV